MPSLKVDVHGFGQELEIDWTSYQKFRTYTVTVENFRYQVPGPWSQAPTQAQIGAMIERMWNAHHRRLLDANIGMVDQGEKQAALDACMAEIARLEDRMTVIRQLFEDDAAKAA
jgi:hypothetical protein